MRRNWRYSRWRCLKTSAPLSVSLRGRWCKYNCPPTFWCTTRQSTWGCMLRICRATFQLCICCRTWAISINGSAISIVCLTSSSWVHLCIDCTRSTGSGSSNCWDGSNIAINNHKSKIFHNYPGFWPSLCYKLKSLVLTSGYCALHCSHNVRLWFMVPYDIKVLTNQP